MERFSAVPSCAAKLSLEAAVREVVYVVEQVKKVDLYCGGETQVVSIRDKTLAMRSAEEIRGIVQQLEKLDTNIMTQQRRMVMANRQRRGA